MPDALYATLELKLWSREELIMQHIHKQEIPGMMDDRTGVTSAFEEASRMAFNQAKYLVHRWVTRASTPVKALPVSSLRSEDLPAPTLTTVQLAFKNKPEKQLNVPDLMTIQR